MAWLVIVAHSAEMIDGNRSREPMTRVFGTLTFGELAVDGFFLISGYLITQSFTQTRTAGKYYYKRILRILPGFIAAYLFCLLIVGPLAGGSFSGTSLKSHIWNFLNFLTLNSPKLVGAFKGCHYQDLNGPMWSIGYEFRCYALITLIGLPFLSNHRGRILAIGTAGLLLVPFYPLIKFNYPWWIAYFLGNLNFLVRLVPIFLCGSLFYLYRDRIVFRRKYALLCAIILLPLLFSKWTAELALTTLGAYILFWFSFSYKSKALSKIGSKTDLSYGLYLYAWPIQNYLIWKFQVSSPAMLVLLSTPLTALFALASWTFIEKPFLAKKNPRQ